MNPINQLRPAQPMGQIYFKASMEAEKLAIRADQARLRSNNQADQERALGLAAFCRRFAKKAEVASQRTVTLLNDGALKDYCSRFDMVFAQFVSFAETCEKQLTEIENKSKS